MKQVRNYTLTKVLGEGTYGKVWYAEDTCHNHLQYAIKVVPLSTLIGARRKYMDSEIAILKNIRTKYSVRFIEDFQTENNLYLVTEFCPGGDLDDYIAKHGPLSDAVGRRVLAQIVLGLDELHSQKVIHRDIKPGNVLLTMQNIEEAEIRLADFGFARYMEENLTSSYLGTLVYMAPEILRNTKYDYKVDIWSLGILAYKIFIGSQPFDSQDEQELLKISAKLTFPPLAKISNDLKDLVAHMLAYDSNHRINLDRIKTHPAISQIIQALTVQSRNPLSESRSAPNLPLKPEHYSKILSIYNSAKEIFFRSMEAAAEDSVDISYTLITRALQDFIYCEKECIDKLNFPNNFHYRQLNHEISSYISDSNSLLLDISRYNSAPAPMYGYGYSVYSCSPSASSNRF
jgi:serine/threonine protein kinase